jgi:DNA-binding MarR family transcriptional regulator
VQGGAWQHAFLYQWAPKIGGGIDQIQRNTIGGRMLGFPVNLASTGTSPSASCPAPRGGLEHDRTTTMVEDAVDPPMRRIEAALVGIVRNTTTRRAHRRWTKEAGLEIPFVAFRILSAVCASGPTRSSSLAQMLDIQHTLVSREVGRLEEEGLVERTADAKDRRARLIGATPAGMTIYRRYRVTLERNIDSAVSSWSEADLMQLAALLERFSRDVTRSQPSVDEDTRSNDAIRPRRERNADG